MRLDSPGLLENFRLSNTRHVRVLVFVGIVRESLQNCTTRPLSGTLQGRKNYKSLAKWPIIPPDSNKTYRIDDHFEIYGPVSAHVYNCF